MSNRLLILGLLLVTLFLVIGEDLTHRPKQLHVTTAGAVEMCLECHRTEVLDPAHAPQVIGCSPCHLGDAMAFDKEKAHKGMVAKNPGDLRVVEKTCGVEGCHSRDVKKVKNSLMATNRGIISTMLYYWGEEPDQNSVHSVEQLLATGENSMTLDYYRKLCGTCHLWKQKGDLPGFFGEKGGGCTACHSVPPPDAEPQPDGKKPHPLIVKKIPVDNCLRCHNRSGRIGLSYTGKFESEGYGTPYEHGDLSSKRLPGDRFYLELRPDIHYEKGMACIDCHTRNEIMGDGTFFAHYEDQLEITCQSCHTREKPGKTRKNNDLNNVVEEDGVFKLTGKLDGKKHPLAPPKEGACDYSGHKRMTCEACHSPWVPQCFGCHVKRDMSDTDLDKLTLKETPGWWSEGRSYIRYEKPMLAVWGDEIVIATPGCQDIVTLLDENGKPERQFNSLTMAALNPHTTRKESRSCANCHVEPKTMGLGEGTVWQEDGKLHFTPNDQGVETAPGITPALDAYVDIDGNPLQKSARRDLRPFNREELRRILRVGQCLPCHKEYNDPAYRNYTPATRCPKEAEWPKLLQGRLETGH
jgi:hypothetical protein